MTVYHVLPTLLWLRLPVQWAILVRVGAALHAQAFIKIGSASCRQKTQHGHSASSRCIRRSQVLCSTNSHQKLCRKFERCMNIHEHVPYGNGCYPPFACHLIRQEVARSRTIFSCIEGWANGKQKKTFRPQTCEFRPSCLNIIEYFMISSGPKTTCSGLFRCKV